jgi:hypothetical protein
MGANKITGLANGTAATDAANLGQFAASTGSSLVGFIQSGTGAVARTVQDKARESVSVKDFGAVGDGATDDTAAIQAAANSVIATDTSPVSSAGVRKTLFFPRGTYRVTAQLTIPAFVTLEGDETFRSTIQFIAWGTSASDAAIVFADTSVKILKNLHLVGTGQWSALVQINRADNNCAIDNCLIQASNGTTYATLSTNCVKILAGTQFYTYTLYCSGAKENIWSVTNTPVIEVSPICDFVDSHITFSGSPNEAGYTSTGGVYEISAAIPAGTGLRRGVFWNKSNGVNYVSMHGASVRGGSVIGAIVYSDSSYNVDNIVLSFVSAIPIAFIPYYFYASVFGPDRHKVNTGTAFVGAAQSYVEYPTLTGCVNGAGYLPVKATLNMLTRQVTITGVVTGLSNISATIIATLTAPLRPRATYSSIQNVSAGYVAVTVDTAGQIAVRAHVAHDGDASVLTTINLCYPIDF